MYKYIYLYLSFIDGFMKLSCNFIILLQNLRNRILFVRNHCIIMKLASIRSLGDGMVEPFSVLLFIL